MIKANELRIGNYARANGSCDEIRVITSINEHGFFGVRSIGKHALKSHLANWFEPILLTPEILEKCGFIKNDKTPFIDKIAYSIFKDAKKLVWCEGYILKQLPDEFVIVYENIYYLHNIQNVIALTGEELIINL